VKKHLELSVKKERDINDKVIEDEEQ